MPKAMWNGVVVAESEKTIRLEGNHYFPPDAIKKEYFRQSQHTSVCPWKGTARYYDLEVDGKVNRAAAWTYPRPSKAASQIKDYVAFWGGVKVVASDHDGAGEGFVARLRRLFA